MKILDKDILLSYIKHIYKDSDIVDIIDYCYTGFNCLNVKVLNSRNINISGDLAVKYGAPLLNGNKLVVYNDSLNSYITIIRRNLIIEKLL